MIRQPRESLLSIISERKIQLILRRIHLSLSSIKRQEFSCRYMYGMRGREGKKGRPVTGTDRIDKYRVTHYVGLSGHKCRSLGLIALSK